MTSEIYEKFWHIKSKYRYDLEQELKRKDKEDLKKTISDAKGKLGENLSSFDKQEEDPEFAALLASYNKSKLDKDDGDEMSKSLIDTKQK